jgi:hypothetical protein
VTEVDIMVKDTMALAAGAYETAIRNGEQRLLDARNRLDAIPTIVEFVQEERPNMASYLQRLRSDLPAMIERARAQLSGDGLL